ncbi:E3 ubiquitin-protein ligase arkadia-A-like [Benincasa hispida]|uniref:E3 ubiquitin-protein ligase arkadia-A-like n=1 Tax=Benincasa hispida TaxID=102211 RepID=UPI00190267BA|nr:E3 ubiquitin-protein ligase arkadia-A-like [Benincasa hispida]
MSSLQTASTFRFSLRRHDDSDDQSLLIRLGFMHRQLSRSPSAGLPYEILHESNSIPMRINMFPLPLRDLEDPLLCRVYVLRLLSYLDLNAVACDIIAHDITSFICEVLAAGNFEVKFRIVADIDHIRMFWREQIGESRRGVVAEETVILEEAPTRRTAAKTAIERLKREKFDGFRGEELGDCCVCCEELKEGKKEVSRIGCGHVYHKSCILTWAQNNDSCPLCRRKIE